MVKAIWPALMAARVCGSRSKPPAATFPTRLFFCSEVPRMAVSPPSTAKMPWILDPFAWRNWGTVWASCVAEAPALRPLLPNITFMPAASRACAAPSMRGWMFSEPGWEMTPTAVSPFLPRATIPHRARGGALPASFRPTISCLVAYCCPGKGYTSGDHRMRDEKTA